MPVVTLYQRQLEVRCEITLEADSCLLDLHRNTPFCRQNFKKIRGEWHQEAPSAFRPIYICSRRHVRGVDSALGLCRAMLSARADTHHWHQFVLLLSHARLIWHATQSLDIITFSHSQSHTAMSLQSPVSIVAQPSATSLPACHPPVSNIHPAYFPAMVIFICFILFIYLKSTTEGPEGHLYCRMYTKTHKISTVWQSTKKEKKTNK